ncbi:MAG: UDP-3-O-(3-hydroxymyristoyl)glucosamine N-acyltransferase [Acidobacteria bacterium]|nr:UDP-3-O-(3-hydroxymyristoyl)glucosamine N-acyltransferase [Acidobacteriota bacterium]
MKTAREIAEFVGGTLEGDADKQIHGVGSLDHAGPGELTYAESTYLDRVAATGASCVLVAEGEYPDRTVILVDNPRLAFARASHWLAPAQTPAAGIHPEALVQHDAVVAPDAAVGAWTLIEHGAHVGRRTVVYPGCYVGAGSRIGDDCVVFPRAVIYPGVTVGDRTVIHAGVVLGADGFGFVPDGSRHVKVPQSGSVEIGSDVEIGANSCVDRAALDETSIGDGVKIDNLCQVGHNVRIGAHAIISAQTGVAGSTQIGGGSTIGGQVGIGDHCRIEEGAIVGSGGGIPSRKRIPGGVVYWGTPARPLSDVKLQQAHVARLPKMAEELKQLRAEVQALKDRLND